MDLKLWTDCLAVMLLFMISGLLFDTSSYKTDKIKARCMYFCAAIAPFIMISKYAIIGS